MTMFRGLGFGYSRADSITQQKQMKEGFDFAIPIQIHEKDLRMESKSEVTGDDTEVIYMLPVRICRTMNKHTTNIFIMSA
jgi:hypothetical protein